MENKNTKYYENNRQELLSFIPDGIKSLLDVGCGAGNFATLVKARKNAIVWGVEPVACIAQKASQKLDKVIDAGVEEAIDLLPDGYFDIISFNDVLEHLIDPWSVLQRMKSKLSSGGLVIASIPNFIYWKNILTILYKKDFRYSTEGIMDKTHLRFFTKKSMTAMFESAGYRVIKTEGLFKSKKLPVRLIFDHIIGDMHCPQYAVIAVHRSEQ